MQRDVPDDRAVKAILLAAGKGTRMMSGRPKVLHEAMGRPLIGWMLDIAARAGAEDPVVVIGHQADDVAAALPGGVTTAIQEEQLGSGHAARVGFAALACKPNDIVLVVPGDMPLISPATLERLIGAHRAEDAAATLLSVVLDDPTGYGRILRDGDAVTGIIEEGDATEAQRAIPEAGTSVYVFTASALEPALEALRTDNSQAEYYLTDTIGLIAKAGHRVRAVIADPVEGNGVNSQRQLATASAELRRRINDAWLDAGVWMDDPDRVWIGPDVSLAPDVRLHGDVRLEGQTHVAGDADIGPGVHIADTTIGSGGRIWHAVIRQADIGDEVQIGPYVSIRPDTVMHTGSKAGTFVELKNTQVGERSKVPHLSYLGDATIGLGSNIGAGTITANYDGYTKNRTTIGDGVKISVDTMLVAPVTLGDDAWTGAGTVVTEDVGDGELAVGRSPQTNIPDYAARRKARAEQETS